MLNPFIKERLEYILDHTETITIYFTAIKEPVDFTILPEGKNHSMQSSAVYRP